MSRVGALALVLLVGCEDQMVYDIVLKRGVAEVEQSAQNIWKLDCVGAAQCSDMLAEELVSQGDKLRELGATDVSGTYGVRDGELDMVFRYQMPLDKLATGDQFQLVVTQSRADVRKGRPGTPTLAVLHVAGSPTQVRTWGPSVRIAGAVLPSALAQELTAALGTTVPEITCDILTKGRGRMQVIVPTTDSDGNVEDRPAWLAEQPGLTELLAAKGLLR